MNIPMAAGLASSACGFASLVKALNAYHGWSCSMKQLSLLARMGSGSACRSLWDGWVHWHAGIRDDGNDSFAEPLAIDWPELCIGLLCLHSGAKKVGSTEAMQRTQATAASYKHWPAQVEHDLERMLASLKDKNFRLLGETAEGNAESMHRLMREASPSIVYSSEATHQAVQRIKNLRAEGLPLYFTQDAGPNLKLLFLKRDHDAVMLAFPELLLTS